MIIDFCVGIAVAVSSYIEDIQAQIDEKKVIFEYHENVKKFENHTKYPKDTQFVLLQFDGSYSLDMWKKTLDFSQEMKDAKKPVRFTYFISGVYFVPEDLHEIYDLNGYRTGHSDIGWGDDIDDISKRIGFVNDAYLSGHEIGSHANGHFDGTEWTQEQWEQEFDYFNYLLFPEYISKFIKKSERNEESERSKIVQKYEEFQKQLQDKDGEFVFPISEIKGFRAPLLGHNDAMFRALENFGFSYETNNVFGQKKMPQKGDENKNGDIWNFPLYGINVAGRNTLAMDYNLYYLQTEAKSVLNFGTPEWKKAHNDVLNSYLNYFNNHYTSSTDENIAELKAPVTIGHHFSLWNDALYWVVMKDFAKTVCGKEKVVCGTGREYEAFLESWK